MQILLIWLFLLDQGENERIFKEYIKEISRNVIRVELGLIGYENKIFI